MFSNGKIFFSLFMILIVLVAGCSEQGRHESQDGPAQPEKRSATTQTQAAFTPVTFTDAFGRQITISKPLERISIGHQFFAEFLVGIGAGDCIVTVIPGISAEKIFYPELSRNVAVSPLYESPDFETIIASGAQVYIVNGIHATEKDYHHAVEKLTSAVEVIGLSVTTMQEFYATVTLLGRMTGCEPQAAAYNRYQMDMLEKIQACVDAIPDKERVRVYFEPMQKGWTINDDCMGFGYPIPTAGGRNIAASQRDHEFEWFETDKEWLAMQNPQVILLRTPPEVACGYGKECFDGMQQHVLAARARPEFAQSNALKNKRIHSIAWDLIGTPRMFIGMAKLFYPERFADLDPRAIHQGYLDRFIQIEVDLSNLCLLSLTTGSARIPLADAVSVIAGKTEKTAAYIVVWQMRMPCILMAVLAGIVLGLSGSVMQGLLRNPLADAYMLGISSTAAFGASLAIIFGRGLLGGPFLTVGNAFLFSVICTMVIVAVSGRKGSRPEVIILIGVAMNRLFQAANTFLLYVADPDAAKTAMFWAVGDLGRANWDQIALVAALAALCLPWLLFRSRDLNILNLGDESAMSMGIRVSRMRNAMMLVSALMVAGVAFFVGVIGFVGLVAPHICRLVIGSDYRVMVPSVALTSTILLIVSDLAARTLLSPITLPVGIVTASLGVPLLVYLIMRNRQLW